MSNKPAWMSSSQQPLGSRPETASSSGAYPSQSTSSSHGYQPSAAPVSSSSISYPPQSVSSTTAYPDGHPSTQVDSGQYPPHSSSSSGSYPEQQHSSSSYPRDYHNPAPVKSEQQGSTSQYPPPPVQSSGIKSENVKSEVKEELVDTDNEEQPEQPKVDDATYTASLNWATAANAKNPNICQIIEKRPIDLPNDVEHIQDVEWADSGPSETHNRAGGSSSNLSNMGGVFQSANSAISKLERASRPKPIRPEACFCEPNLTTQTMCCTDTSCALFACQEECGTNCPAGPLCGNKRITKKEWKPLSVFDAGLKGRGLMVQQSCQPGDFIVEYVGVAVKKQYLDGLFSRYKHERMLYIMALDGNVYIDARHRGGIARYINHSCEPNCVVHRWKVKGISRAGVFALKEIKEGEELSFDYQWERKRGRSLTKCHCGSVNCRGTIESSKTSNDDDDDEEEEFELEGEWMEQREGQLPGKNIMNRTVKVYEPDDDLWNVADVAQYDNTNGNKHLLMYHGTDAVEEHWVDLSTRKWMILVEPQKEGALEGIGDGQGSYAITRKNEYGGSRNNSSQSLLINAPQGALGSNANTPRSDGAQSPIPGNKGRSYLYIQTPVKDIMVARHTLFKCSQYSRVHIDTDKLTVPHNWGLGKNTLSFGEGKDVSDEEEAQFLSKAYDNSKDGVVWKLSVTGKEVAKAVEWLEKILGRINADLGIAAPDATSGLTPAINGSMASLASAGGIAEPEDNRHRTEVIIPRIIVAETKTRFFSLKGYCYNCEVKLTHSDSKSKQFAKFTILSETESDLEKAREYLSGELDSMCRSHNAPMTKLGVYKDLGWMGGELSNTDYRHLFGDLKKNNASSSSAVFDAFEDLQGSAFATSFMKTNRCTILVQSEEDMGRLSNNRLINEATPYQSRKIFFSTSNTSRVSTLWGYMKSRLDDLRRGVYFYPLGSDRVYLSALMAPIRNNLGQEGGSWNYFFEFVEQTSGAKVGIDPITGNTHLRVDGGDSSVGGEEGERQVTHKIDIAMELIHIQIELFRDHHIRKQRWGFGRDWALLLESDQGTETNSDGDAASTSKSTSIADSLRLSGTTAVGLACLEISEMITGSGLSEKVAAHACTIFYRYINLPNTPKNTDGSIKLRDIQLASLYIANKSQKVVKWRRLDAVLEHAYRVFYPGSLFNPKSEEAKNWERRVIKAEKIMLTAMNYDVFWSGVDWVINAVVGTKAMAEPLAENAMGIALSGHVLAAGPLLWLKYGPKYAFAAICGLLSFDIEPLFPALNLQPLTVSHAAELIYHSSQSLSGVKKSSALKSKHEIFSDAKSSSMGANIQKMQNDCATYLSKHQGSKSIDDSTFVSSPEYKGIGENSKLRRVFRGVPSYQVERQVLPVLAKICFESKCTIRFSDGIVEGSNDIILEGNWKSLAIAEELLCEIASLSPPVPFHEQPVTAAYSTLADQDTKKSDSEAIKSVKIKPGLLDMKQIDGKHGWYGTLDSTAEMYDAGWKTCVAGNAPQEHLDTAGLRWWVPHQYGPSLSGSLCEIFSSPKLFNGGSIDMKALALMAQSFAGGYTRMQTLFPALSSFLTGPEGDEAQENDTTVPLSLQRWPPEKVQNKEQKTAGEDIMQMGYSAAALQEMQLLHELHFLIPSPQGHPNFILPLAIALDTDVAAEEPAAATTSSITAKAASNDILAMLDRNQRATSSGKKQLGAGSHLVLEPTPINLQKVLSRYSRKNNGGTILPSAVLASWCHDILSAISFCHSNHVILRSLLPDQIHIDHSGTAKLSGLSKVMVLHGKDRTKEFDPLKKVRSKKGKDHNTEDVEPFAAPELLLGGTRHTKETDMWAFGALLANLLIGKQLFPGKDRVSKMTQVFKIVGVPDRKNYDDAKKFPFYSNQMYVIGDEGKKKKYNRGVEKAMRHLLKAFGNEAESDYAGLISLIDGLLHLDPKKRMTAEKALRHPYMMNHSAHLERREFRQSYVKDWLDLKENVLTKGKSPKSTIIDTLAPEKKRHIEEPRQVMETAPLANEMNFSVDRESKRKAFLMDASSGADGDDLYGFDDLLGGPAKKSRFDM